MTPLKGVDLSHWESVEDWKQFLSTIDFFYTKASQGTTFPDPKAAEFVQAALRGGKDAGVYLVIECGQDVQKQLAFFKKCLAKIGRTTLRHAIDFERDPNKAYTMAFCKTKCMEMVRAFSREFGQKPILYFNSSDEKEFKFSPEEAEEFDTWLANYNASSLPKSSFVKRYFIWQHSDKFQVPGVGSADHDYCYGTLDDLRGKTTFGSVAPVTPPAPAPPPPVVTPVAQVPPSSATSGDAATARKNMVLKVAKDLGLVNQALHLISFAGTGHDPRYWGLIDMRQDSSQHRFHDIDADTGKVIHHLVAHGSGSDPNNIGLATKFSNLDGSKMTSLGVVKCAELYTCPKHGLELHLDGLENSNSHSRSRAIVMHRASYVSDDHVGRSSGCPALKPSETDDVIQRFKNGSLVYIFNS